MFDKTCLHNNLLPNYTIYIYQYINIYCMISQQIIIYIYMCVSVNYIYIYTHTHIYIYIYIYIYCIICQQIIMKACFVEHTRTLFYL